MTSNSNLNLNLHVRSRSASIFQGKVASVSSVNQTGEFDILPMHANFITLIKDYVTLDKGLKSEKKIPVKNAVMSVIDGNVEVYVEI